MTYLFFESRIWLAAVLIAAQFVAICLWSWRRSKATERTVWFGFAAIPLLLIVSWLVITARERIIVICDDLAKRVEAADVDGIGRHIAPEIAVGGMDRDELLDRVRRVLQVYHINHGRISDVDVTQSGQTHVVDFNASCDVSTREVDLGRLPTRWRVSFRPEGKRLLITHIEMLPVPPLNARNLEDLLE